MARLKVKSLWQHKQHRNGSPIREGERKACRSPPPGSGDAGGGREGSARARCAVSAVAPPSRVVSQLFSRTAKPRGSAGVKVRLGRHWGAPCVGRPGACWSGAGSGTHAAVGVLGSAPRMHTGGSGCQGHGRFPDGGVSGPWLTCHSRRCQRLLGALRGAGVFPAQVPSRPHCPGGPAGLSSVGGAETSPRYFSLQ